MTSAYYDEAVRYVRCQSRISTKSLADSLGIRWSQALDYLEEMKRQNIVGEMRENGWWPVLRQGSLGASRNSANFTANKSATPPPITPAVAKKVDSQATSVPLGSVTQDQVQQLLMEKLREAMRSLAEERAKNQKLGNNCRLLFAEREAWRHRALAAEARLAMEDENEASQQRPEAVFKPIPNGVLPDPRALTPPGALNGPLLSELEIK